MCNTIVRRIVWQYTPLSQEEVAPTPAKPKFFLALFLQYVDEEDQKKIYAPNMEDNDQTRLRVLDQSTLRPGYVTGSKKSFRTCRCDIHIQ